MLVTALSVAMLAPVLPADVVLEAVGGAPPAYESWLERPAPVARPTTARGADPLVTFVSVDSAPEGDLPRELAYTPDGTQVVVVHRDTGNLTFLDAATLDHVATVAVGAFPVDVAITPDGRYAVAPCVLDDAVAIVDIATHTLAAIVPVTGAQPFAVEVTADSARAVVGVINDGSASSFSVIDLDAGAEERSIAAAPQGVIGFGWTPESGVVLNFYSSFALTADGERILLPDFGGNLLHVYDAASGSTLASIPVAAGPRAAVSTGDSAAAIVTSEGAPTVSVVDLGTFAVTAAHAMPDLDDQIVLLTPDEAYAIVSSGSDVQFVELATGAITSSIFVGNGIIGDIAVSHDGVYAFVSSYNATAIKLSAQSLVGVATFAPSYEMAVSPTTLEAVTINNRFREDLHQYKIAPGTSALQRRVSGPPPEGDVPYGVDISADGATVVSANLLSETATIIDAASGTVLSHPPIGIRGKEVRLTPDGAWAVVCGMDAHEVAVLDVAAGTRVAALTINDRPGRVRIHPDGTEAYVLNVAGSDRISFIELDGADSTIVAQVSAGQTGVANGPAFTETSGIELSPDGSTLAVCDSFNDLLRLYDTASRTQVAAVPVGDFPLRVGFSPDGTRAYVVNHFSFDLSVVAVDGPASSLLGTVANMSQYPLVISATDTHAYVGTTGGGSGLSAIRVVDAATLGVVATINLAPYTDGVPRDSALDLDAGVLYVLSTAGELLHLAADGPATTVTAITPLSGASPDLALSTAAQRIAVAQPLPDGVDIVHLGGACPGDADGDGAVGVSDLLIVLADWGGSGAGDVTGDGMVNVEDLLLVLGAWGDC